MDAESPYVFERGQGLVHIRLRSDPAKCIADVRVDAFDIVVAETRRQAFREASEAAARAVDAAPEPRREVR